MTDSDSDYEYDNCVIQKCKTCNSIFKNYKPNKNIINCIMCRTITCDIVKMN